MKWCINAELYFTSVYHSMVISQVLFNFSILTQAVMQML